MLYNLIWSMHGMCRAERIVRMTCKARTKRENYRRHFHQLCVKKSYLFSLPGLHSPASHTRKFNKSSEKRENKKLIQSHQLSDPKKHRRQLNSRPGWYILRAKRRNGNVESQNVWKTCCSSGVSSEKKETIIIIKALSHWISYYRATRCDLINAPIQ